MTSYSIKKTGERSILRYEALIGEIQHKMEDMVFMLLRGDKSVMDNVALLEIDVTIRRHKFDGGFEPHPNETETPTPRKRAKRVAKRQ